jgi:integrase
VAVRKDHRGRQEADRELAGREWHDNVLVFTTQMGDPLYPDTVTQLMPKLIDAYNNPADTGHARPPGQASAQVGTFPAADPAA